MTTPPTFRIVSSGRRVTVIHRATDGTVGGKTSCGVRAFATLRPDRIEPMTLAVYGCDKCTSRVERWMVLGLIAGLKRLASAD